MFTSSNCPKDVHCLKRQSRVVIMDGMVIVLRLIVPKEHLTRDESKEIRNV